MVQHGSVPCTIWNILNKSLKVNTSGGTGFYFLLFTTIEARKDGSVTLTGSESDICGQLPLSCWSTPNTARRFHERSGLRGSGQSNGRKWKEVNAPHRRRPLFSVCDRWKWLKSVRRTGLTRMIYYPVLVFRPIVWVLAGFASVLSSLMFPCLFFLL